MRLADGRFLVLGEGPRRPARDQRRGAVRRRSGDARHAAPSLLRYRRVPGYRATDAALLPDGRLLILNRRFAWLEGFSAVAGGRRRRAGCAPAATIDGPRGRGAAGRRSASTIWRR